MDVGRGDGKGGSRGGMSESTVDVVEAPGEDG